MDPFYLRMNFKGTDQVNQETIFVFQLNQFVIATYIN